MYITCNSMVMYVNYRLYQHGIRWELKEWTPLLTISYLQKENSTDFVFFLFVCFSF